MHAEVSQAAGGADRRKGGNLCQLTGELAGEIDVLGELTADGQLGTVELMTFHRDLFERTEFRSGLGVCGRLACGGGGEQLKDVVDGRMAAEGQVRHEDGQAVLAQHFEFVEDDRGVAGGVDQEQRDASRDQFSQAIELCFVVGGASDDAVDRDARVKGGDTGS